MSELSSSTTLLLETAGVLYGLLLAYYAFSLGRTEAATATNWDRLRKWMSGEPVNPRPDSRMLGNFTKGVRHAYDRRMRISQLLFSSSVLFVSAMFFAGLQLAGLVPPEWGDLVVSTASFLLLAGVPAVFAVAAFLEHGHAKKQLNEMLLEIWNSSPTLLGDADLEKFRLEWSREFGPDCPAKLP